MSFAQEYEHSQPDLFAIDAAADERAAFIRRTYAHLCGAILAFVALEAVFLNTEAIRRPLVDLIGGNWWLAFIAFLVASWIASRWAHSDVSQGTQYAGLALYTLAWAFIFVPLLHFAVRFGGPNLIPQAGFLTMFIFVGLTAIVFMTKADFSFLRNILWLGMLAAVGVVIVSIFTGFSPGIFFAAGMVVLMSGFILYDTSNVLHHYRTDQHVAASLALFASIATLFWYVVSLLGFLGDD